ncbi:FapA family protein [Paucibacter sp. O1-1]|nr:FapA family protein [Paucibacter sp. O1-1]MDA3830076.1 FapA family protein [Paucibacter sp. O1-1]
MNFFVIAERKDGSVIIDVSEDKMQASMTITSAWGGKDVSLPDILTTLKSKKIKNGTKQTKDHGVNAALIHTASR